MFDCSKEIMRFYDIHVRLSAEDQRKLAGYRDANIDRVKKGLKNAQNPAPVEFINQGSYAMDTIIQHPDNDYDLDIGVMFEKSDFVGLKGDEISSKDAREMLCSAVQDNRFSKAPEVRLNCVRIYYNDGYHIDMPVYRQYTNFLCTTKIEIASSNWSETNPRAVTDWFCSQVIKKSPDENNGRQMRRIVRLIKFWAQSKLSNKPSGFIISKLVDECYSSKPDRDDKSLLATLTGIQSRLSLYQDVYHPIIQNVKISEGKETAIKAMFDKLESDLKILAALNDSECTIQSALKIWKKFFNHEYFNILIKEASDNAILIAGAAPKTPVEKQGGERFA